MPYTIEEHKHRFAAWAAGRAASVNGCRFSVEAGVAILEEAGFDPTFENPNCLPTPECFDAAHRQWRRAVVDAAKRRSLKFSHGVAAKLINVYLKSRFVCGGHHSHARVMAIHPPIDSVLLDALYSTNFGGLRDAWAEARAIRWSKFDSDQYEAMIRNLRLAMHGFGVMGGGATLEGPPIRGWRYCCSTIILNDGRKSRKDWGPLMTKYWCANFDVEACLEHGLQKRLWLMQYQYADGHHEFQGGSQKSATTRIWRRLAEVEQGDRFVAYLPGSRFFAVGTVIAPRRPRTSSDATDTIEHYVKEQKSHLHQTGCVYYTPVFYEDFTDEWRFPGDPLSRYAQRIDVDAWRHYNPDGVTVTGLSKIPPYEIQMALFEIERDYFQAIAATLRNDAPPSTTAIEDAEEVTASLIDVIETDHAGGQGFVLNSTLRRSIENHAMEAAKRHFVSKRYRVEDHSQDHPYDLFCIRENERLYVEVKGTQTSGDSVFLTAGEVAFARQHRAQMGLYLLHSIRASGDEIIPTSGQETVIVPWNVDGGCLKPLSFKYELP